MTQEQATLELLQRASAHPLPLDEVVTRLGAALRRNLSYLARRQRRGRVTAYDELLEMDMEALASAVHYLQHAPDVAQSSALCIDCHQAPRLFDSARCAACQQIADDYWQQFQARQAQQKGANQ